jgi:uncharacterized lipoprotein YddW (UPF0748 family)
MSLLAAAAGLAAMQGGQDIPTNRFILASPFPLLRPARIDDRLATYGIANSNTRRLNLQARILWVDGTANLDAVNTPEKARAIIQRAAAVGFNTVIYDVKPIIGRTLYPSKLATQLTSWRMATQPAGNDPLKAMADEAKALGVSFFAALNAFSEGHRYAKEQPGGQFGDPGWGYGKPELQTWQYVPTPILSMGDKDFELAQPGTHMVFNSVAVFTGSIPDADRYVALDANGVVVGIGSKKPAAAPAGGSVMAASGTAVVDLDQLRVGMKLNFDTKASFQPIEQKQTQIPLMMNPHLKANQDRALSFIKEILSNYNVSGVVYDDRLRFGGFNADFSESTRADFEKKVGKKLTWPDDVFKFTCDSRLNMSGFRPGPYFDAWMLFRAQTMEAFVHRVRETVDKTKPGAQLALYAGSWYGDYVNYGANYGSDDLAAGFPYLNRAYQKTSFTDNLDFIMTGCYYPVPTIFQALEGAKPTGRTVEAAGVISNRVVRDKTWCYGGLMISDYYGNQAGLEQAMQTVAATTQGVMLFDYSHKIDDVWPMFQTAFRDRAVAPHQVPGLLEKVRKQRRDWDAKGYPDAPFPLLEGAPGAGF